jgi:bifunctional UDP-N-acetylglucosamine pyrophosphorylase / glucosamine-1-phosphate N-acetyltransferase
MKKDIISIVLAAGKGSRMASDLPKVLHKVAGQSMISMILDTLNSIELIKENILVLGTGKDEVLEQIGSDVKYVVQNEQLGTGHAVKIAKDLLSNFNGDVLIAYGDCPLLSAQTIEKLINSHQNSNVVCTVLTAHLDNPTGYGRILKTNNLVTGIVEELDASADIKEIKEVNSGVYVVNNKMLFKALDNITNNNVKNEYYLTDIIGYFVSNGLKVNSYMTDDILEIQGVNTKHQLDYVESIVKFRNG